MASEFREAPCHTQKNRAQDTSGRSRGVGGTRCDAADPDWADWRRDWCAVGVCGAGASDCGASVCGAPFVGVYAAVADSTPSPSPSPPSKRGERSGSHTSVEASNAAMNHTRGARTTRGGQDVQVTQERDGGRGVQEPHPQRGPNSQGGPAGGEGVNTNRLALVWRRRRRRTFPCTTTESDPLTA